MGACGHGLGYGVYKHQFKESDLIKLFMSKKISFRRIEREVKWHNVKHLPGVCIFVSRSAL